LPGMHFASLPYACALSAPCCSFIHTACGKNCKPQHHGKLRHYQEIP
jgi:hypothetical protein